MPSLKSLIQHAHSDHQDFHPPLIRLQHSAPHPQGHHPNKPEAGPAQPATQASPAAKPESTAVGSK